MKKIEELADLVTENGDVPEPQVTKVVPTVRTNAEFPPPSWSGRAKRTENAKSPKE